MKLLGALALLPMAIIFAIVVLFSAPTAEPGTACAATMHPTGVITPAQAAAYDYAAGFRGQDLVIDVAVEKAESNLNTDAVQAPGPIGAPLIGVGLEQDTPCDKSCLDPVKNVAIAYGKFLADQKAGGNGWRPWTTVSSGAYLAFMTLAQQGVAQMSSSSVTCSAPKGQTQGGAAPVQGGVVEVAPAGGPYRAVEPGAPFCSPPLPDGPSDTTDLCTGMIAGQCTWWAAYNVDVSGINPRGQGDAWQWFSNAPTSRQSRTPALGDVLVYSSNFPGSGGHGHVAVVIGIQGSILVLSEMNYLGVGIVDERNEQASNLYIIGYVTP